MWQQCTQSVRAIVPAGLFVLLALISAPLSGDELSKDDWTRFRGNNGTGRCRGKETVLHWNDSKNMKWKAELPGPGVSSPIVIGDRVFLTCYSGYGIRDDDPGAMEDLRRHLICFHRDDGRICWSKTVPAVLPEDPFSGIGLPRHGYASNTPTSDGERVYVFFGKSGVLAFDMDGRQLWHTSVGRDSGRNRWGSAASPIVYRDLVIVNASDESRSLVALDKFTGREVWRAKAELLESTWATPILMNGPNGPELVLAVPGEIWGLNPDSGKLKWFATGFEARCVCASLVPDGEIVYHIGGNPTGQSGAVKTGGQGDVTDTHVLWTAHGFGRISSPVFHRGHLYGVSRGVAYCVDAATGQFVSRTRLETGESIGAESSGEEDKREHRDRDRPGKADAAGQKDAASHGRDRHHHNRSRRADYGSVIMTGGKVYATSTEGIVHVFAADPQLTLLASNKLADDSGFDATPAVSRGQLFLRSNRFLYCIAAE